MPFEPRDCAVWPPMVQRVEHDLGICVASKDDAITFQLGAQISEVVDLTVVREDALPVGCQKWLMSAFAEVDDTQSDVAERDVVG